MEITESKCLCSNDRSSKRDRKLVLDSGVHTTDSLSSGSTTIRDSQCLSLNESNDTHMSEVKKCQNVTASLNYIGSKHKLCSILEEKMRPYLEKHNVKTIADLFCGSGAMSRHFYKKYNIISNDILYFVSIVTEAQLNDVPDYEKWIDELNKVTPIEGIITENYSPKGNRMFFTVETAKKIDGMRIALDDWRKEGNITQQQYVKLLGTLIHFADKHANVASVYGAFLKNFKATASKDFVLKPVFQYFQSSQVDALTEKKYKVYNKDILTLHLDEIEEESGLKIDAIYLDPPYNHRSYAKNYSPLEMIAKYDGQPIQGKTGLRKDSGDYSGLFCKKTEVRNAMKNLSQKIQNVPVVFMSYNNEGLLSENEIKEIFEGQEKTKSVICYKIDYERFASKKNQKRDVEEYLFIIEKKYSL